MIQSGKAAEVVQEFLHAYLVQRNIERASKASQMTFIGMERIW